MAEKKHERTVGVYDSLKPEKNVLNKETLSKFVSLKPGLERNKDNYMVIDNLVDFYADKIS